jgi:type III restriction enzyme
MEGHEMAKSPHLLWQMATGSGKTLIMAALMLEMYQRGERNFWFFVTSNNIITKTIDNFTNQTSSKYQFAPKIEIDGRQIEIKQVESFAYTDNDAINIKFSTINILHQISQPELASENAVSLEELSDTPIILIGDEAHHLNAATKKEKEDESSWENSVQLVLKANKRNRLFEFTATANLTNEAIARKYNDKLIYNYDLRHFRNDKYSKDVFTQSIDIDLNREVERIMLRTILISQYRKHVASDYGIYLKPVILFKSKGTTEKSKGTEVSKASFDKFNVLIRDLQVEQIEREFRSVDLSADDDARIWNKTVKYFHEVDLHNLVSELKIDFDVDTNRVLIHDGTNKRKENQDRLINTLEETDNPVRAIFAVNVLDEGWDVLNLFDIVRLYDTRDGGTDRNGAYKPGGGTVAEAQLIGRGARYYPFTYKNLDRYKRKFDDNEAEPLRVIEQMHYHCRHNPRYITEIRQTLVESGIIVNPNELFEYALTMKEEYRDPTSSFQQKSVYENAILPKKIWNDANVEIIENEALEQNVALLPDYANDEVQQILLESGTTQDTAMFGDDMLAKGVTHTPMQSQRTVAELIPDNILRFALNSNKNFDFDKLKRAYPHLSSMSEYIKLLGKKHILVAGNWQKTKPTPDELLQVAQIILSGIAIGVKVEQKKVYVTKAFQSYPVQDKFEKDIVRKVKPNGEEGKSQKDSIRYAIDLSTADWYVYNDNYGTSEEKSFVKWFAGFVPVMKENDWQDIALARNEKAVKLYSWQKFNLGEGFEPDFVLFATKDNINYVFYIEPKGDWAYDPNNKNFGKEQWKEDFLLDIETVAFAQQPKFSKTQNYCLIGLPFYNEQHTKEEFRKAFEKKAKLKGS